MMYGFAKGQTATTIAASPKIVSGAGSSILIEGTVMDLSPAQPNTPAISDDSMSEWMEYLHMGRAMPTNATGVPVTLIAIDDAGHSQTIGQVTSDMSGFFSFMWSPTSTGKYTIVASFGGSASYYSSYAETAIGVVQGSSASPAVSPTSGTTTGTSPTVAPTSPGVSTSTSPSGEVSPTTAPPGNAAGTEYYIVAAAVVVVVVIAAIAVVLRKRK
jgi:hypothetical protein